MKELKQLPLSELNSELQVNAQVMEDKVFLEMQVEHEDIDAAVERLNLESNPEYQKLVQEYMAAVQEIKLGQSNKKNDVII